MRRTRSSSEAPRCGASAKAPRLPLQPRTAWTARDGRRPGQGTPGSRTGRSSRLLLLRQLANELLGLLHIVERELAGFHEVGDHWLWPAAEKGEEVVDEAALGGVPGDGSLEDVRVADFLETAERLLPFQPVDHRLHGGVGRAVLFRKGLLDFAHRRRAARPQRV